MKKIIAYATVLLHSFTLCTIFSILLIIESWCITLLAAWLISIFSPLSFRHAFEEYWKIMMFTAALSGIVFLVIHKHNRMLIKEFYRNVRVSRQSVELDISCLSEPVSEEEIRRIRIDGADVSHRKRK